jgi:hypothetical protein
MAPGFVPMIHVLRHLPVSDHRGWLLTQPLLDGLHLHSAFRPGHNHGGAQVGIVTVTHVEVVEIIQQGLTLGALQGRQFGQQEGRAGSVFIADLWRD